jgi:GNAT superfamily N-acetyltransferase
VSAAAGAAAPIAIRKATPEDAPAIHALHEASIRAACARHYSPAQIDAWIGGLGVERCREAMRRLEFLVADEGGRIAGFSVVDVAGGELHALYVAPGSAGRGLGRALLGAAERIAAAWGLRTLRLKSTLNAEGFYARRGYVRLGEGVNRGPTGVELPCIDMLRPDLATGAGDAAGIPGAQEGPNPAAPAALSLFAFLVGRFHCETRVKRPDGGFDTCAAARHGRYILGGLAIADSWRQVGADGGVTQYGLNVRSYDAARGAFVLRWFDALASTWLDMGPEDLGGVTVAAGAIWYLHRVPPGAAERLFPKETLFRNTFHDITPARFLWRAEIARDRGGTWEEVQTITSWRMNG